MLTFHVRSRMTELPNTFRSFRRCSHSSARWMEMSEPFWKTAISRVEPNKIVVRGYNLMDLIVKYSYADLTYLLWRGELPSAEHSRMMDALLTVCLEHSLNAPSVDATRFVASSGVPLQAAVSAGVAAIGDWHGGAIEQAAKILQDGVARMKDAQIAVSEVAGE